MESRSLLSSPPLSYQEALDFWFGRINYEQRTPRPSDLKLDRMRTLLGLLGDPQERLRIVHVAGSKGKGSTSAMLDSILRHAGYRTGLFTSPHLCKVEERIQVNRTPIGPKELASLMEEIRAAVRKMEEVGDEAPVSGQAVTFFEVATALGFLHFVQQKVDVAVIEVGLGGRFDSTNVCRPLVSVITSISFDHTQQLGKDLASIAMEKAGIVKPGRMTISGVIAPEARQVIQAICDERHSVLRQLERDFNFEYEPGQYGRPPQPKEKPNTPKQRSGKKPGARPKNEPCILNPPAVQVTTSQRAWPAMAIGLWGEHQAANAAVAVSCVEQLREIELQIDDLAVQLGLLSVHWPARAEIVYGEPIVVLDCAHNVASAQALIDTLRTSLPPTKAERQANCAEYSAALRTENSLEKRLLVFAGSNDKDLPGILQVFAPHFDHIFLTRYSHSPRAVPVETLADILRQVSRVPFTLCPTPVEAWQAVCDAARSDDLICITGSVFLAGELRPVVLGNRYLTPIET
jgi:dihydrofolate synthase/folylpolyglutamate synthase